MAIDVLELRLFAVPDSVPLAERDLPEIVDGFVSWSWELVDADENTAVMRCDVCDHRIYIDADDPVAVLAVVQMMHPRPECEAFRALSWGVLGLAG